ncbi:aminotransferase class I/II-fold pyridoxal phosphate-dependent enzyme [Paenibacillus aurantiacus]|uniref:Aminotransferase n=1 Tax=Paenibacillus aurantiacus TaxID=1936118 RepID=A0ABV5KYJ1_9BACL
MKKSWRAEKLDRLGSSIFAEVSGWKREAVAAGLNVIDLSIGSPDQPPAPEVRQALADAALRPDAYAYPGTKGSRGYLSKVAAWMAYRFGVEVNPETELLSLMGTQDGLGHLALSLCNPGDIAMIPNPGYPVYAAGLAVAGVEPYLMPLREERGYLPDFDAIPDEVWRSAKFMLLNYPSNPLSAVADLAFYEHAVAAAKRHGVLIVHDLAYSEMAFDGFRPPSILQVEGAQDVAVEFHSMSKSFNLAGGRIGFVAGNAEAVSAMTELKGNIDFGVFLPVQEAAIAALERDMTGTVAPVDGLYERRRDLFLSALEAEGWIVPKPKATMFVWAKLPPMRWEMAEPWNSRRISREMLARQGVAVIPGDAFGSEGEGYVRIALVEDEAKLLEAAQRIGRFIRGE